MKVELQGKPAYTAAYVFLDRGESILADRGAMMMMSGGMEASGTVHGGVAKAFLRRTLGGENFFQARYTAQIQDAWVALGPPFPGDIETVSLDRTGPIFAQSGSVLAHAETIEVDVKFSGAKRIALREGATALRLHGTGQALLSTYGAMQEFDLEEGETITVDTGHLVAWSASCRMEVGVLGGMIASQLTGEGLVGNVSGPGHVWTQTRAEQNMRSWILPDREQNARRS